MKPERTVGIAVGLIERVGLVAYDDLAFKVARILDDSLSRRSFDCALAAALHSKQQGKRAMPLKAQGGDVMSRPFSVVRQLPRPVRAELDQRIDEGRESLDELLQWIKAGGYDGISRSALGRYSQAVRKGRVKPASVSVIGRPAS